MTTEISNSTYLKNCLCCDSTNLRLILDLKTQPLANSYLKSPDDSEQYYPLELNYCTDCTHLQLSYSVDPELLFKNYLYVSGTTQTLRNYFQQFAQAAISDIDKPKHELCVLDIACNDGSQLDAFKTLGCSTYGIDPAQNLHELSSKNHTVIADYFNTDSLTKLEVKQFDIIVAQNVFAHNRYPQEFLRLCKQHLAPGGRIYVQTSQADMVQYGQFDTIYHEHISFFNTRSLVTLARKTGLYLEKVKKPSIHGTSYVFVLSKDPAHDNSTYWCDCEPDQTLPIVQKFARHAVQVVTNLQAELIKYSDCLLVGYGAAAKGNTLLNFGEINLNYIVDDNPLKVGLYTPGRKVPIVSLDQVINLAGDKPVVWVPLSWNFFDEIQRRVLEKYKKPTIFVKYFPTLETIQA